MSSPFHSDAGPLPPRVGNDGGLGPVELLGELARAELDQSALLNGLVFAVLQL